MRPDEKSSRPIRFCPVARSPAVRAVALLPELLAALRKGAHELEPPSAGGRPNARLDPRRN
jgi:hypothetical protein